MPMYNLARMDDGKKSTLKNICITQLLNQLMVVNL